MLRAEPMYAQKFRVPPLAKPTIKIIGIAQEVGTICHDHINQTWCAESEQFTGDTPNDIISPGVRMGDN